MPENTSNPEQSYGGWYPSETSSHPSLAGWRLQWMAFGQSHQCPTRISTTDERIASALERIAHTLELMQQTQTP